MTAVAKTSSRCRSCQAPIVFARNRSNRVAPFEPDPNGEWTIENCPAADQWRRK
jgi:hypothetical protein